jgi:xanthosine utilization system XapX-like protein
MKMKISILAVLVFGSIFSLSAMSQPAVPAPPLSGLNGEAVTEEAVTEEAVTEEAVTEEAVTEEDVAEEAATEESVPEADAALYSEEAVMKSLIPYIAVAKDDISLCEEDRECSVVVEDHFKERYSGQGRCFEIEPEILDFCKAVQKNDCTRLDEYLGGICRAFFALDVDALLEVKLKNYPADEFPKEELALQIGFFQGYRQNKYEACQDVIVEHIKADDLRYYACKVLFASDVDVTSKEIAHDFSLLKTAQAAQDAEQCANILDPDMQNDCYRFAPVK